MQDNFFVQLNYNQIFWSVMPDESCRTCGGELATYLSCSECRKTTQKICKSCNAPTPKQFHTKCMGSAQITDSKGNQIFQFAQKAVSRKSILSGRPLAIIFGVIGFFALGFATAAYLGHFQNDISISKTDSFQNQLYSAEGLKSTPSMINVEATSHQSYENCLAYGSGESLTVTCPTQYGYVYKAILGIPRDLADKFSGEAFSIRGVSLIESLDGSVILHYQNNDYKTNFFAS